MERTIRSRAACGFERTTSSAAIFLIPSMAAAMYQEATFSRLVNGMAIPVLSEWPARISEWQARMALRV
eukprot:2102330-Rhodomonas_salina.1